MLSENTYHTFRYCFNNFQHIPILKYNFSPIFVLTLLGNFFKDNTNSFFDNLRKIVIKLYRIKMRMCIYEHEGVKIST